MGLSGRCRQIQHSGEGKPALDCDSAFQKFHHLAHYTIVADLSTAGSA